MFIQTEQTPNPATLKFLPGRPVMGEGTANFPDAGTAAASPLAAELFQIDGVSGVFFGADFITVSKDDGADWPSLKPLVLNAVMQHFTSGAPLISDPDKLAADADAAGPDVAAGSEASAEVVSQIKAILDDKVRPAVAQDGGDILYHNFEDGVVYLHMQGACSGCPSSTATLKQGIENLLRYYIPEVQEVRPI